MAFFSLKNVSIRGISACVPSNVDENSDISFYTAEEAEQIIQRTGIERKHVVRTGMTNLDLCEKAFETLIDKIGWETSSIDAVVYVTQTEDYITPPNVFLIHDRLGLSENCFALDVNHGCPGWVVGLSSIASMISLGNVKRAILFEGDNNSTINYKLDRECRPLFGDCGTCTALEFDTNAAPMEFYIGTNSKDGSALLRKKGGCRNPYSLDEYRDELDKLSGKIPVSTDGSMMDGASVFSFGISTVPKAIKRFCSEFDIDLSSIDKVVLHQANKFMNDKIVKKIGVAADRVPSSLKNYGNTTGASIPLTIVSECNREYSSKKINTVCCGFGTGLSWGVCHLVTEKIACPDIVEL